MGFIKNRYMGRTFIQPTQGQREDAVKIKLESLVESVVRGQAGGSGGRFHRPRHHQRAGSSALLREAGATEVHMRVSAPPFRTSLLLSARISTRRENLIACQHSMEEIARINRRGFVWDI